MKISAIAKKALIPYEQQIKSQEIENGHIFMNKDGKHLDEFVGDSRGIAITNYSKGDIYTHNHPIVPKNKTALSIPDIRTALKLKFRELRAVTVDGFCHLVEVPESLNIGKRDYDYISCLMILENYEPFFEKNGLKWPIIRKLHKELEKVGGLKFRTIKLPQ